MEANPVQFCTYFTHLISYKLYFFSCNCIKSKSIVHLLYSVENVDNNVHTKQCFPQKVENTDTNNSQQSLFMFRRTTLAYVVEYPSSCYGFMLTTWIQAIVVWSILPIKNSPNLLFNIFYLLLNWMFIIPYGLWIWIIKNTITPYLHKLIVLAGIHGNCVCCTSISMQKNKHDTVYSFLTKLIESI